MKYIPKISFKTIKYLKKMLHVLQNTAIGYIRIVLETMKYIRIVQESMRNIRIHFETMEYIRIEKNAVNT